MIRRPENRRVQGSVIGKHLLEAYTRRQKVIARSSAEAELYAAALGASESKRMVSMMRDLGYQLKPVLVIDAKATEHVLHPSGIGRIKLLDVVAHLWVQDEVRSGRLTVRRVKSELNVADSGTKALEREVIAKHARALGCRSSGQVAGANIPPS